MLVAEQDTGLRDKHKGWPGQVSGGGEGWAGPSTGQQPLPGFLTAPLFEAGFLDIQEMGDITPNKGEETA